VPATRIFELVIQLPNVVATQPPVFECSAAPPPDRICGPPLVGAERLSIELARPGEWD
jgi:hypothetical protein